MSLEGSTPSPSALGNSAGLVQWHDSWLPTRRPGFESPIPLRLGNRLTGRLPDFESGGGGSNPPSRRVPRLPPSRPGTPTGRAVRLKPGRVWVRIPPWVFLAATRPKIEQESGERSEETRKRIARSPAVYFLLSTCFSRTDFPETRLGRQPADHSRSEREMLRVRIPPEPQLEGMRDEG